jgi:hypothetical protein
MSYLIYKILKFENSDNEYSLDRSENWTINYCQTFGTYEDAFNFIKDYERDNTTFIRLSVRLSDDDKENFLNTFCKSNDLYLLYRRYFIGDPREKIYAKLKKDGIKLIES